MVSRKYLFVCKANVSRSKVGERFFREGLLERGFSVGTLGDKTEKDFYVASAGFAADRYGGDWSRQYTPEMGDWADVIFTADKYVDRALWDLFEAPMKKIICLDIEDNYDVHNPNDRWMLENLMRERLTEYLPERKS